MGSQLQRRSLVSSPDDNNARLNGSAGDAAQPTNSSRVGHGDITKGTSAPITTVRTQSGQAGADSSTGVRDAVLMALLAVQSGAQPLLTKNCLSRDIIITSQVMACEGFKVALAGAALMSDGTIKMAFKTLRPMESLAVAIVPAAIYALQNTLIQVAYRHVDGVTFSLLNQTKLLFTALFNFAFLRRRQSRVQMVALFLMLLAAALLTSGSPHSSNAEAKSTSPWVFLSSDSFVSGVVPLVLGAMTSGLGSTYSQWIMQVRGRNPHLFSIEMCSLSFMILLLSTLTSADGVRIRQLGFFHAWTALAVIPPLTQAIGGILVGLVTKYAGGLQKGFCIIFGLVIAAFLQFFVEGKPLSPLVLVALPLVISSTYLHSMFPYVPPKVRND